MAQSFTVTRTDEASAAQGFVETAGIPSGGINIPGDGRVDWTLQLTGKLSNWSKASASAVYYFKIPECNVNTKMVMKATSGATVKFKLTVYDPEDTTKSLTSANITVTGTGADQTVDLLTYKFPTVDATLYPKGKYYRFKLDCLQGNTAITYIDRFKFLSDATTQITPPSYLSSPSVHLAGWKSTATGAPTTASYDWIYEEVMLPTESDLIGTYTMSLGALSGYMGIQVNSTTDHSIIFSTWDNGTTDGGKTLSVDSMAAHVDWNADLMTPNRFGGEGSGVQCLLHGQLWHPGTYIRFLSNARTTTKTYTKLVNGVSTQVIRPVTLVTAWFDANDGKGWQYIATLRHPHGAQLFDSWYSFLENYNWPSGQMQRRSYYRNGFAHKKIGNKWFHCNKLGSMSNTDGGDQAGARTDFGHGQVTDKPGMSDTFVMWTGGFNATQNNSNTVPLITNTTIVDTILLTQLAKRVDLAIANEKAREDAAAEKSKWVLTYSTEETTGEGTNGRAAEIIDGNTGTYWTNAWQSGTSALPHWFNIDFTAKKAISGLNITAGSFAERRVKSITVQVSDDGVNFRTVYTNTSCPAETSYTLSFDSTAHGRYLKFIINASYSGNQHTRLYELDPVFVVETGITDVATPLVVAASSDGQNLYVKNPTNGTMTVDIYGMNGQQISSTQSSDAKAAIAIGSLPTNIYIARCTANGKRYSTTFRK